MGLSGGEIAGIIIGIVLLIILIIFLYFWIRNKDTKNRLDGILSDNDLIDDKNVSQLL